MNKIIKLLSSIPIILITLYFIPFIGICLILLRYFVSDSKKRTTTPIIITIIGLIILIPKGAELILNLIKIDLNKIPYLSTILESSLYTNEFMEYSKFLISAGIIFLIISFVTKSIFDKVSSAIRSNITSYIRKTEQRDAEISKQNDLEIKLKKEKAKNTTYIKCPNCGSDNLISEKTGVCKYCRGPLINENYK